MYIKTKVRFIIKLISKNNPENASKPTNKFRGLQTMTDTSQETFNARNRHDPILQKTNRKNLIIAIINNGRSRLMRKCALEQLKLL